MAWDVPGDADHHGKGERSVKDDGTQMRADSTMGTTRRDMLIAVVAGFGLSTAGLFVPAWLEEAAAWEGADGGKLGGRRGQNRRGRDKRRNHGDRKHRQKGKDNNHAPGSSFVLLRDIAIYVHNQRPDAITVRGWELGPKKHNSPEHDYVPTTDWLTLPAKPSNGPEPFHDFVFSSAQAAVQINFSNGATHYVTAFNASWSYPHVDIGWGVWGKDGRAEGGYTQADGYLDVNETRFASGILVQRIVDNDTHIQFLVTVQQF
jgi:hypothetical protein